MPLTYTNILIRKQHIDSETILFFGIVIFYCLVFFIIGSALMKNYSE